VADETDIPVFGAWVRERLHARRMSQRQLARRAAVHPSTVSRILRGAVPTLATALALQHALDPSEPSGPASDSPELHPALLSAMLRRDGLLTNDEIDQLVSTYAQLVASSSQRAARSPRVRVPAAGPREAQNINAASPRSSRSC
jgi:transcriptional regulator with XRE-family HTH domain